MCIKHLKFNFPQFKNIITNKDYLPKAKSLHSVVYSLGENLNHVWC